FDEWSAANLDAFSKVIEHAVEHIAAQTRTPPHYLVARMVNTAAESLTIAEAGLVSKTRERITFVKAPLRRLFRLIALALGDPGKADAAQWATLLWSNIQYRSEAQLADALLKKRQTGYPLQWIAEQDGLDPAAVARSRRMQRLSGRAVAAARGAWRLLNRHALDVTTPRYLARMLPILLASQQAAASSASSYVDEALREQGLDLAPVGELLPMSLVGSASDGR